MKLAVSFSLCNLWLKGQIDEDEYEDASQISTFHVNLNKHKSLYSFPIISPFFGALDQRASFRLVARCLSLVKIAVTSSSASLEVDTASCINPFWLVFLASDLAASFRKSMANYPTPWSFTRFFPPGHRGMDPKVQLEGGAKHLMMKEARGGDPTDQ